MIKTKGGYAMVDLAHVSLSGVGVTFAGLYQKLYSKIGKPILLCNVNIGGTEYQDCYVQPVYTAEGFEMTVGDYTVTVASNSVVTATEGIVGGEAGPGTLAELTDVDIDDSTLQEGDILKYDATQNAWVNGQPSAGATELTQLVDVGINLDTLQEGDVLTFDATQLKWTNTQPSGGGAPWTQSLALQINSVVTLPTAVGETKSWNGSGMYQWGTGASTFINGLLHAMESTDPVFKLCDTNLFVIQSKNSLAQNVKLSMGANSIRCKYKTATMVELDFNGVFAFSETEASSPYVYGVYYVIGELVAKVEDGELQPASVLTVTKYA